MIFPFASKPLRASRLTLTDARTGRFGASANKLTVATSSRHATPHNLQDFEGVEEEAVAGMPGVVESRWI